MIIILESFLKQTKEKGVIINIERNNNRELERTRDKY